jgi:hypothetical protein
MARRIVPAVAVALVLSMALQASADPKKPTGKEIDKKVKAANFKDDMAIQKERGKGDTIRFVPASVAGKRLSDFEDGEIIGFVEISKQGSESDVKAGKYHCYAKKSDGEWRVWLERGSEVYGYARHVDVSKDSQQKPKFRGGKESSGIEYSFFVFSI